MLFVLVAYVFVCIYGIKIHRTSDANYLSKENTLSIKGIFILMVFMSHFNAYCEFSGKYDGLYLLPFKLIGQGMVTMFLFYSGYGVMESIRKRENYVNGIPKNRMLNVLFQFDIAVLPFAILKLVLGEKITISRFVLSLIGWESLGNSNWYIFAILVLYAFTYISFKIFKKKHWAGALGVFVLTLFYIVFILLCKKGVYWCDTALCYSLGMFWSLGREKLDKIINKNIFVYILLVFVSVIGFFLINNAYIRQLFLTVGIVLVTMRLEFGNKILKWCGDHLFELYILQRIPMIIFDRTGFIEFNMYLSFVFSLCITVLLAILFKKYIGGLTNKILNKH